MKDDSHLMEIHHRSELGSYKNYVFGIALCLLLTFVPYFLVTRHMLSATPLIATIVGLGLVQAVIQLILFLHLGKESKPHWNLLVFIFMALVAGIIVTGSLWIMFDLDNRVMSPKDMETYMLMETGIKK